MKEPFSLHFQIPFEGFFKLIIAMMDLSNYIFESSFKLGIVISDDILRSQKLRTF